MPDDEKMLREQYADATNLQARSSLHARFSVNKDGWTRWVFNQFDLPPAARILELGCGNAGLWSSNRSRVGESWKITLSDFSPGMLEDARQKLGDSDGRFTFQVIDAHTIPFADAAFDAVIANHMLYHVSDLNRALGEVRRVLVPQGRLYATANGEDHMQEVRDLVRPIVGELSLPFVRRDNAHAFSLQNGAAKLSRHFGQVQLRNYPDALEITEVQPLMGWILSIRGAGEAFTPEKIQQLEAILDACLKADGVIHVTKTNGMFIAHKSI